MRKNYLKLYLTETDIRNMLAALPVQIPDTVEIDRFGFDDVNMSNYVILSHESFAATAEQGVVPITTVPYKTLIVS